MLCSVTLGHQMPLPGSIGGMSDDRPAWPTGWPKGKLTWDASIGGVHLTDIHLTTSLCDQCSHTHGHQMSLHWGWIRLIFCLLGSQPASQLARCDWPTSWPCDKISTCQALVGQICGGRRTRGLTTLGPSPGSQHSHWFPLGSDLPDQSQPSNTNELCSLLYTFGTTLNDHLQFCIYAV